MQKFFLPTIPCCLEHKTHAINKLLRQKQVESARHNVKLSFEECINLIINRKRSFIFMDESTVPRKKPSKISWSNSDRRNWQPSGSYPKNRRSHSSRQTTRLVLVKSAHRWKLRNDGIRCFQQVGIRLENYPTYATCAKSNRRISTKCAQHSTHSYPQKLDEPKNCGDMWTLSGKCKNTST